MSSKPSTQTKVSVSGTPATKGKKTRPVPEQYLPDVGVDSPVSNLASNSPKPSTSRYKASGSETKTPKSAGPKKGAKLTLDVLKRLVDSPVRKEPTIPVALVDSPASIHDASTDEDNKEVLEDIGEQGNSSIATSTRRKKRLSTTVSKRASLSTSMQTRSKKAYKKKKNLIVNEIGHFENGIWWCKLCDKKTGFGGRNATAELANHAIRKCYPNLKEMISKQNASHIFEMFEEILAALNIRDDGMSNDAIQALFIKHGSDFQAKFDGLKVLLETQFEQRIRQIEEDTLQHKAELTSQFLTFKVETKKAMNESIQKIQAEREGDKLRSEAKNDDHEKTVKLLQETIDGLKRILQVVIGTLFVAVLVAVLLKYL